MYGLFLTITIFIFSGARSQSCQNEIDQYHKCVEINYEDQHNLRNQQRQERQNKTNEKIRQCFLMNNCKEPIFDNPQHAPKTFDMLKTSGPFVKRLQCNKGLTEKMIGTVEQCVQSTQPDFHFYNSSRNRTNKWTPESEVHFDTIDKNVNEFCPEESRQTVQSCVRDAWKSEIAASGDPRKQFEANFNQSCQFDDSCFKAMNPACQKQFNDNKKPICDCSKKLDKIQLEDEYKNCTTPAASNSQFSPVDSFVNMMCDTRDLCVEFYKKGFKGNDGH